MIYVEIVYRWSTDRSTCVDKTRGRSTRSSEQRVSKRDQLVSHARLVNARAPYTVVGGWNPLVSPLFVISPLLTLLIAYCIILIEYKVYVCQLLINFLYYLFLYKYKLLLLNIKKREFQFFFFNFFNYVNNE